MNPDFNDVCGFTEKEFDVYFTEHLPGMLERGKAKEDVPSFATIDDLKKKIFDYYDGYFWDGENRVLNPFSLVKFLDGGKFQNFWFRSGTPDFLLKFIGRKPLDFALSESRVMKSPC